VFWEILVEVRRFSMGVWDVIPGETLLLLPSMHI
jgi:hypothetical protein